MKNKAVLVLFLTFFALILKAQKEQCKFYFDTIRKIHVYYWADHLPTPKGGIRRVHEVFSQFYRLDSNSVRWSFTFELLISSQGALKDIGIYGKKPENLDKEEEEAMKVMKKIKKWYPAKCNGKVINFLLRLPIRM